MEQVEVLVRHDILRCDVCGGAGPSEGVEAGAPCVICEREGEAGVLRRDVAEAQLLVDEANMENVEADPAFVRTLKGD